ncbi:hypothetical protein [Agromyces bauzanensis]|uniref:hypothetical protein n=1 Tax=Agromyces bauzanensis TaxID=1308924 RepID=UPI00166C4917|nr:hypothetical protein [Agromyces bauzanensis]
MAVLAMVLAMVLGSRAASTPGVRAFILWCESILGTLLLVPIMIFSSPATESGALSRAECGLTEVGSAAIAAILLIPAVLAAIPALLSFSKLAAAVANLVAFAASIVLWAAVFMAIRPWEYPGW